MSSMWEPYTERARKSIVLAQEEAQRLGQAYVGTEHMLLGLLREGGSVAAKLLEAKGVTVERTRQNVEMMMGRAAGRVVHNEMVFTPRAKRSMELAAEEAKKLNQDYIGTEHLLLGIIQEGEGVGARVLTGFGVKAGDLRESVLALMGKKPEAEPFAELREKIGAIRLPHRDSHGSGWNQALDRVLALLEPKKPEPKFKPGDWVYVPGFGARLVREDGCIEVPKLPQRAPTAKQTIDALVEANGHLRAATPDEIAVVRDGEA
jgi:ATP-dependent Clp protease ATP-binding subunit ClpC